MVVKRPFRVHRHMFLKAVHTQIRRTIQGRLFDTWRLSGDHQTLEPNQYRYGYFDAVWRLRNNHQEKVNKVRMSKAAFLRPIRTLSNSPPICTTWKQKSAVEKVQRIGRALQ